MAKVFRPSTRESSILNKIESSKEYARRKSLSSLRDCADQLSNTISMKLVESKLVETTNAGSRLTKEGMQLLSAYRRFHDRCEAFVNEQFREFFPEQAAARRKSRDHRKH